jgi:hypothetical protein
MSAEKPVRADNVIEAKRFMPAARFLNVSGRTTPTCRLVSQADDFINARLSSRPTPRATRSGDV